ncbi:MAG: hypothetical protein HRT44_11080 [Bdellovibrionales bacterium]|nr:hypothetical protein [Bdellovibrionales bacterium]NQZ19783.1 hypothetical protein [Bdellovibrionales bacterium]
MYSLNYYLAQTPGLRRLLRWKTQRKISHFKNLEDERKNSDPLNLRNFEDKVYSQNGEDGILQEIFRRIGTTNQFFVEFGVENGQECNGRYLLEKKGWQGLWIDGSKENVQQAKEQFSQFPIKIFNRFITKENILSLFTEAEVPQELDLLSIDIDGNDYWIWDELKEYLPRVVVIEYNAKYSDNEDWVMPYNAKHVNDGSSHFGASLAAYSRLAKKLGYCLVACDNMGVNAFFVRKDLITDKFTHIDESVEYHYCSPKYRSLFFGHPNGSGRWK